MAVAQEFRDILATYDVLSIFERLPMAAQERFSDWITGAQGDESQWSRIEAFVLALRLGPLQAEPPEAPPGTSEVVG